MPNELKEAITSAVTSENTNVEATTPETTTTTETTTAAPVYSEDVQRKIRLAENLLDPDLGPAVLRDLAEKAGIIAAREGTTPKQAAKTTLDVLKENIAPEWHFLFDQKFAKGLEQIIESKVEEKVSSVRQQQQVEVENRIKSESEGALDKFYKTYTDANKFDAKMLDVMKKLPIGEGVTPYDYMEMVYKVVNPEAFITKQKTETKQSTAVKHMVDRMNKNAAEHKPRSSEVTESSVTRGSKLPSLKESVLAAMNGERFS
jgi:hypothetical protein